MKAIDIKSCPFCGCTDIEIAQTNPNAIWFRCDYCGAQTSHASHIDDALAFWNQRADDDNHDKRRAH